MKHNKFFTLATFIILAIQILCIFHNKPDSRDRKLEDTQDQDNLVDVRGIKDQNEKDNPLSQLFEADHMKIAKQNVNLNMNMPLNRLKLHLDNSYQVKIVVSNDEDFDALYDYFYPKKQASQEALEEEGKSATNEEATPGARRLSKIKKFVKK